MATFRNRHGKWQARVQCEGQQPISKSFQSKQDAVKWAMRLEPTFGVYAVRTNIPRIICSCDS